MSEFSSSTFDRYTGKWLIGTGIFLLVLGGIFLVLAFTDAELLFGFVLTAAILGGIGLALVLFGFRARRWAADAERVTKTGLAGTATVTGMTQTGMSLNDQPQIDIELMVTVPGRPAYAAHRKEFVPLMLLGRLSAGAALPVKVDPADPQDVIIDWTASESPTPGAAFAAWPTTTTVIDGGTTVVGGADAMAQVQAALAARGMSPAEQTAALAKVQAAFAGLSAAATTFSTSTPSPDGVDQLRAVVRATGTDATATIETLVDSGQTIGDERLFTMGVTLHVPGGFDRRLPDASARVPVAAASKVAVGQTVPVKIAIDDPDVIVFEWERLSADGSILPAAGPTLV